MTRPGNTKQVNISLRKDLYEKVQECAEKEHRSISNYIATVLADHIENKDKPA